MANGVAVISSAITIPAESFQQRPPRDDNDNTRMWTAQMNEASVYMYANWQVSQRFFGYDCAGQAPKFVRHIICVHDLRVRRADRLGVLKH